VKSCEILSEKSQSKIVHRCEEVALTLLVTRWLVVTPLLRHVVTSAMLLYWFFHRNWFLAPCYSLRFIQGDSRGETNILRGDSTGHCERKTLLWIYATFWMLTEIPLFLSANTRVLWMVIKKEKLPTINFNFIFCFMFKWRICYTEIMNLF